MTMTSTGLISRSALAVMMVAPIAAGQQEITLERPVPITLVTGEQIDVGNLGFASPHYRDMTGDGVPDLLVGELGVRALRIYENRGSAASPAFTGFDLLETTTGIALTDPG